MTRRGALARAALALGLLLPVGPAGAFEQIIRPYQSARSSGMGGVRLLTGLYDENFFGNPARASANKERRAQVWDTFFEVGRSTLSTIGDVSGGGGSTLTKLSSTAGRNNHARLQTAMPAFYWDAGGPWNYALSWIMSSQLDFGIRNSYRIDPASVTDIGPSLTVSRKLLDDERLAVGGTAHLTYRLSTKSDYSFVDLIQGATLNPQSSGGERAHFDFDAGATYRLPVEVGDWDTSVGASVNNVLDGKYNHLRVKLTYAADKPRQQPRAFGFGASLSRPAWWKLSDVIFAVEFSDIGNNKNGSLFRTLHLGGEARWRFLKPRLGLNQGYWAAGLGVVWGKFELDLATYGEELTLNVGGKEDRRFALRLAFHI